MIYIPTQTGKVSGGEYALYSPNKRCTKVVKADKITIWDNYTFYLLRHYRKPDKHEFARDHYLWLIDFIKQNYVNDVVLITPDVDWLKYQDEIEKLWEKECSSYPQLYVPNTWKRSTENLNIIGYGIRKFYKGDYHQRWNHCLGHKRDISCKLLTYDKNCP